MVHYKKSPFQLHILRQGNDHWMYPWTQWQGIDSELDLIWLHYKKEPKMMIHISGISGRSDS